MADIVQFDFGMNTVRTLLRDGEIWFVGKDVAEVLGYTDTDQAVRKHCKAVDSYAVETTGQVRNVNIIPERDLYRLIFRSRLPEAERFEDWVVSEVLPALRKNGTYSVEREEEYQELDHTQLPEEILNLKPHVRSQVLGCALQAAKMDDNTPERIDYYFAKYAAMVGAKPAMLSKTPLHRSGQIYQMVEEWLACDNLEPATNRASKYRVQSKHLYNRFKKWCYMKGIQDIPGHHSWAREARKILPYQKSNYYFFYVKEQIEERAA